MFAVAVFNLKRNPFLLSPPSSFEERVGNDSLGGIAPLTPVSGVTPAMLLRTLRCVYALRMTELKRADKYKGISAEAQELILPLHTARVEILTC